jgi:hypothetical protein
MYAPLKSMSSFLFQNVAMSAAVTVDVEVKNKCFCYDFSLRSQIPDGVD